MSPLARMELERYNRIRKEAKKRERQFSRPPVRIGLWFRKHFSWVTVSLGLMWVWWRDL